jgi:hypothetical protein
LVASDPVVQGNASSRPLGSADRPGPRHC